MTEKHIDPETQLARFRRAVALLGGNRASARALKMNERQIRFLVAGERALHDGFLRDISSALIDHADECRKLEREISPAFRENLTPQQREGQLKPHHKRYDQKDRGNG